MMSKPDPKVMPDWEIAAIAEEKMKPIFQLAEEMGIESCELLPHGHYVGKVDYTRILNRLHDRPDGKYIDVTAMNPTPFGEGKSTTTIGLIQGLGKLSKKVSGAIRQPSGGPTFNMKGSAAGGGLSQCIPLAEFSLGLTGDIDAVTNAHNLAMVALTSRLQHEFNYTDDFLAKKNLKRLNINPRNVSTGWAIDFCAQALREMIIGLGGDKDGFTMQSGFQISVSSEVMAILAIATSLPDFRRRMGQMILAYDRNGRPVTTADLEVDGAMTAIMLRALNPNLLQTIEGQPVLVHAGPFANIAIGQSSIVADLVGLKLSDYHVTESGFGADIGFEKFWNLKCRSGALRPHCAVIVVTVRALKMHGGGPAVVAGKRPDPVYRESHPELVEKGLANLLAHIEIVKQSGITPVVCINHFESDTADELAVIERAAATVGVRAVVSRHWSHGGEGAAELAQAVIDACEQTSELRFLYEPEERLRDKIEKIALRIYGADGVSYTPSALEKLNRIEADPDLRPLGVCMAKTQFSLSHDPALKGRPTGWTLPVTDFQTFRGAGLIVPVAGDIKLMPGTSSDPAFRRMDVDLATGKVKGLF